MTTARERDFIYCTYPTYLDHGKRRWPRRYIVQTFWRSEASPACSESTAATRGGSGVHSPSAIRAMASGLHGPP